MYQKCLGFCAIFLFPIYLGSTATNRVSNEGQVVFCESADGTYLECNTDYIIRNVSVELEMSNKRCSEDVTWGYGLKHLWVKDSCRASFRVFAR